MLKLAYRILQSHEYSFFCLFLWKNQFVGLTKNLKETEKELTFVNLKALNFVKLQNINTFLVFYMELESPKSIYWFPYGGPLQTKLWKKGLVNSSLEKL